MGKIVTVLFSLFSLSAQAQLFNGPGGAIQNTGQETYFNLPVSGLTQTQLDNAFGIEEVCINISHPAVEELYIYLKSPSGTVVELTDGNNCKGADYAGTCFNSTAGTSITVATAPYLGSYRGLGFLGRFNSGQPGNGSWTLIVKDYLAFVNSGNVVSWSIKFSNTPVQPLTFVSSDLPIVVINTGSQSISDTKILANMGIIYNGTGVRNYMTDPLNNYNGKAMIRFRGNTSRYFEKKPYAIETSDAAGIELAASLLGMPAESEWNLIAMYQDKSLIRVPLTYDLARQMGHYATRFKNVEVVINNEYQGVYSLMEKIKRDSNRVDIAKLTALENSGPAMTGGYIIKIDRTDEPGWNSLLPGDASNNAHFFYQFVYPKDSDITVPQSNYIKSFVDSFETAMSSATFTDPTVGYKKYIAVPSFVDYFIINELSKNVDAYRLSTYLYKNNISKGGKLHIGPVWDYDLAWHNCNYGNSFDPTGWQYQLTDTIYPTPTWWKRFMQDTSFVNAVYCRWLELRQNVLSDAHLFSYIDSSALALNESQQRNFMQWPILGAYIYPNPQNQTGANYQAEVNDLKSWVAGRVAWIDGNIPGHCLTGIGENDMSINLTVYPNPSHGKFTIEMEEGPWKMEDATLEIHNTLGKNIHPALIPHVSSLDIDISFQPKGIYFFRLKVGSVTKAGKIVIQ